jgi:hypothetical protein
MIMHRHYHENIQFIYTIITFGTHLYPLGNFLQILRLFGKIFTLSSYMVHGIQFQFFLKSYGGTRCFHGEIRPYFIFSFILPFQWPYSCFNLIYELKVMASWNSHFSQWCPSSPPETFLLIPWELFWLKNKLYVDIRIILSNTFPMTTFFSQFWALRRKLYSIEYCQFTAFVHLLPSAK